MVVVGGGLAGVAPQAVLDGIAGMAVMSFAVLASGAYALGGGVVAAEAAASRAVVGVIGRWLIALCGLVALAARDGAVVWAVAAGAVVAQAAYLVATMTFKRV